MIFKQQMSKNITIITIRPSDSAKTTEADSALETQQASQEKKYLDDLLQQLI